MGLFDFGKRPKSALNRDRKYFNSSEEHERKYAKSFKRRKKKYSRYDGGGEIPDEYLNKADVLIENDDSIIYDIAGEYGQIVDNVKHMRWFREEVAQRVMEGDGVEYANGGGIGDEFYVGQSIIINNTSPYYNRMTKEMKRIVSPYYNKELVIDKITSNKPHNLAKAFVRSSGEKVPFDIVLNKKYIEQYAKGGGTSYKPYGKTKGRFTLTYNVGGEKQTEVWDSLEEATDNARRYSSVKLGYSDVRVFDDSGKEYLFSSGGGIGDKEKKQWVKSYLENTDEDDLRFILADIWGDSDYLDVMSKEKMISDIMKNDNNEIEYIYKNYKGYSKGGGVELRDNFDYGGSAMTDENVVRENLSNGEIHCDILTEIIGCKPQYPNQIVGSIKLEKCFLRPYYRIA